MGFSPFLLFIFLFATATWATRSPGQVSLEDAIPCLVTTTEQPRILTAPGKARLSKDLSTASSSPIPVEKAPLNQIEKVECERKMAGTSKVEASEAVAALKRQVPEKLPRMTVTMSLPS